MSADAAAVEAGRTPGKRIVCRCQHRGQPVVIALWNRIVFVIVTARASNAQTHHGGTKNFDLPGDHIHALRDEVLLGAVSRIGRGAPEAGRGQQIDLLRRVLLDCLVIEQLIAGELLSEKTVERLILVERANHKIPKAPGMRPWLVGA